VGLALVPVGWLLGNIAEEGEGLRDALVVLLSFLLYAFGVHFLLSKSAVYLLGIGTETEYLDPIEQAMKLLAPLMVALLMTVVYVRSWMPFITAQFSNMLWQRPSQRPKTTYDLAEAAHWKGQTEEAIQLLEEGAKEHPKDSYPLRRLSELLMEKGEYEQAAEALIEAAKRTQGVQQWADLSFRLVDILDRHLKRREEAVAVLEEIISNYPTSPCAQQAQVRKKRLRQQEALETEDPEEN